MPHELIDSQGNELLFLTNQDVVLLASASRNTTQTSADQTNYNGRGVKVVLDWLSGTGNVTLAIKGKDPASGKYFALLTGGSIAGASTNVYTVYPGVTAAANVSASDVLPRTWQVVVTANNSNACTYTVGYSAIV